MGRQRNILQARWENMRFSQQEVRIRVVISGRAAMARRIYILLAQEHALVYSFHGRCQELTDHEMSPPL